MVLELGPCPTDEVSRWVRFARRIVAELRTIEAEGEPVSADMIDLWSRIVDDWSITLDRAGDDALFRWSRDFEPEVAEFMLHGLDLCLNSPTVMSWVTEAEADEQRPFTVHLVNAFVDGLTVEGRSGQHLADQVLGSLQSLLADTD